jgi:hypothetical protein
MKNAKKSYSSMSFRRFTQRVFLLLKSPMQQGYLHLKGHEAELDWQN